MHPFYFFASSLYPPYSSELLIIEILHGTLQQALTTQSSTDLSQYDVHDITGAIKSILAGMEPPLLTYELYTPFLTVVSKSEETRLVALLETLGRLPRAHRRTLEILIRHLRK